MQAKIKTLNFDRFKLACDLNDIEITDTQEYRTGIAIVQVKCKTGSQLFNAGVEYEALKDEDV